MKSYKLVFLSVFSLMAALSFFTNSAWAEHDSQGGGDFTKEGKHGSEMDRGRKEMNRLQRMLDQLDLNDAQKQQVKSIMEGSRESVRNHYKSMMDAKRALRKQGYTENYSDVMVKNLARQMASAIERLQVIQAETQHKIYMVLTSSQREKLREMEQDRKRKFRK